ncbi:MULTISPECIES: hypothetical protein [unclassified Microcoleus]|uniref:hypothetical protein n=1 Tax=unclassified Microcoleus TaxID=2642155 RepID=UPI002FD21344
MTATGTSIANAIARWAQSVDLGVGIGDFRFTSRSVNLGLEQESEILGGWRRVSETCIRFWAGVTARSNLNCSAKCFAYPDFMR